MAEQGADLSGLLNGLLSNPGALTAVLGLLGKAGGGGGGCAPEPPHRDVCDDGPPRDEKEDCGDGRRPRPPKRGCPPKDPPCEEEPYCPPPPLCPVPCKATGKEAREALFRALMPYLSPERCQMLEGLLQLLNVLDLFWQRKGGSHV